MNIIEWIDRLSVKNPIFGNLPPCPFARNSIYKTFENNPERVIEEWDDSFEIAVVFMPDTTSIQLTNIAKQLSNKEFLVLEDHPEDVEEVLGYNLNYGEPLLLITKRSKMDKARESLRKTNYYSNFSEEDYKDLMNR